MTIQFTKPQFFYHQKVENHDLIKCALLPHILSYYHTHQKDSNYTWGITQTVSSSNHENEDDLYILKEVITDSMYKDIIWNPLDNMMKELHENTYNVPQESFLSSLWWNVYPAGSFAQPHTHRGHDLSGVYFLHMNERNTLMFQPASQDNLFAFTDRVYDTEHIPEGHVILFPSMLQHYVNPCKEMRVSISFNIRCSQKVITSPFH